MNKGVVEVMIQGCKVKFPYEPYGTQLAYMSKLILALKLSQNGLLESPTGTGKSLALLCAVLAFQEAYYENLYDLDSSPSPSSSSSSSSTQPCTLRIYYATRTHSQLKQILEELKKTPYRPKMCLLGAKERLCIHPKVRISPNVRSA